jgi:hypothetical protein
MNHNIFFGKLLKVEEKVNDKKETIIRLIFKSQKFDRGLEEMVACSQPIKLDEAHHSNLAVFKSFIGKEIYVPVHLIAMDGNIFYRTNGVGLPLQIAVQSSQTQVKTTI